MNLQNQSLPQNVQIISTPSPVQKLTKPFIFPQGQYENQTLRIPQVIVANDDSKTINVQTVQFAGSQVDFLDKDTITFRNIRNQTGFKLNTITGENNIPPNIPDPFIRHLIQADIGIIEDLRSSNITAGVIKANRLEADTEVINVTTEGKVICEEIDADKGIITEFQSRHSDIDYMDAQTLVASSFVTSPYGNFENINTFITQTNNMLTLIQAAINTIDQRVEVLEMDTSVLRSDVNILRTDVNNQQSNLAIINTDQVTQNDRLSALEAKISSLQFTYIIGQILTLYRVDTNFTLSNGQDVARLNGLMIEDCEHKYPEFWNLRGNEFIKQGSNIILPNLDQTYLIGGKTSEKTGMFVGNNQHILTIDELPAHTHVIGGVGVSGAGKAYSQTSSQSTANVTTGATGTGKAIDWRPFSFKCNYYIVLGVETK